jgi:hypothetical protein
MHHPRTLKALALIPALILAALPLAGQEVLRGEVRVDLEPVFARYVDEPYPLDTETAQRRALEEAAMFFSAMIYGWSFSYDIGERARGIPEELELERQGSIPFGDPGLFATDAEVRDMRLYLWTDYRLTEGQKRRVGMWRSGRVRNVQATGRGPLGGPVEGADWPGIITAALEDAAREGLRAMLRGGERNRPKAARGFIALAEFPRYWMDAGRWALSARFRVELTEIQPFAAY